MKTISYTCYSCSTKLTAPLKSGGRQIDCPMCGVTLNVPTTDGTCHPSDFSDMPNPPDKTIPKFNIIQKKLVQPEGAEIPTSVENVDHREADEILQKRPLRVARRSFDPPPEPSAEVLLDDAMPLQNGSGQRNRINLLMAAMAGAFVLILIFLGIILLLKIRASSENLIVGSPDAAGSAQSTVVHSDGLVDHVISPSATQDDEGPSNRLQEFLRSARLEPDIQGAIGLLDGALVKFSAAPNEALADSRNEVAKLKKYLQALSDAQDLAEEIKDSIKLGITALRARIEETIQQAENDEINRLEKRYDEAWAADFFKFPYPFRSSTATDDEAKAIVSERIRSKQDADFPIDEGTLDAEAKKAFVEWKVGDVVSFADRQGRRYEGELFAVSPASVRISTRGMMVSITALDFSEQMKAHIGEGCIAARFRYKAVMREERSRSRRTMAQTIAPKNIETVAKEHNLIFRDGNFLTDRDMANAIAKKREDTIQVNLDAGRDGWVAKALEEKGFVVHESEWVPKDYLPIAQELGRQQIKAMGDNAALDEVDKLGMLLQQNRGAGIPILKNACDAYPKALYQAIMRERGFSFYGGVVWLNEDDYKAANRLDNLLLEIQRDVPSDKDLNQTQQLLIQCEGRNLPNESKARRLLADGLTRLHTVRISETIAMARNEKDFDNAIETLENAIAENSQARNLTEARAYLRELHDSLNEARQKAEVTRQAQANQKGIVDCLEKFLNQQRLGYQGSQFFDVPALATSFFAVRSWEILEYGWQFENRGAARVRINSSTKGGIPITVLWRFHMIYRPERGWRIFTVVKL